MLMVSNRYDVIELRPNFCKYGKNLYRVCYQN